MTHLSQQSSPPEILAPAGDRDAFLAAVAAGADSIYCGLQRFSARMQATNFAVNELARLTELARDRGVRTYVALNALIKPEELTSAGQWIDLLNRHVHPDGLILQDLAAVNLARQTGFRGELHLSTLAQACLGGSLRTIRDRLGVSRVVLPRELSLDEIKDLSASCPPGLELEVFVHGALCYAVSGRCYWSSFLGGKSGLRGNCVQPCRRLYTHGSSKERFFSCLDLRLDVLSKTLLDAPAVRGWKIEGRKKGPHYVFYTIRAYQLLRDHSSEPEARKEASALLDKALGRPGTSYSFLPQSPKIPVQPEEDTGSGMFAGKLAGKGGSPRLKPRTELLPGDLLRIGYQDLPGHRTYKVSKYVPRGGGLTLPGHSSGAGPGLPVFLVDRRERQLQEAIAKLAGQLRETDAQENTESEFSPKLPRAAKKPGRAGRMEVVSDITHTRGKGRTGLWLTLERMQQIAMGRARSCWFWLPPAIWPDEEGQWLEGIRMLTGKGARRFVLGAPWQRDLFPDLKALRLLAGPFCNTANPLAVEELRRMGLSGAIVSPELSRRDYLQLPRSSPLPLGMVTRGLWPCCVSRTAHPGIKTGRKIQSPKQEIFWLTKRGQNRYIYPNVELDLTEMEGELEEAGYSLFVHLESGLPQKVPRAGRTSTFNWDLELV
ncbi:MAG: U32 family peptidase [Desulfohalobiaceae bacterium]|nr:U32 family peptidase [Desulfohalobiaceae bacterium]